MDTLFEWTRLLTAAAFSGFGWACLTTDHLRREFERYRLARWRRLVGALELAGALGLAVATALPVLLVPAALGLMLLMALAVVTRIRIRDPFVQILPALVLLVMTSALAVRGAVASS